MSLIDPWSSSEEVVEAVPRASPCRSANQALTNDEKRTEAEEREERSGRERAQVARYKYKVFRLVVELARGGRGRYIQTSWASTALALPNE